MITGGPAEIYTFGTQASLFAVAKLFSCIVFIYIGLPVIYDLQHTTVFEYLNLRYNNSTRMVISFLFILRRVSIV